MNADKNAENSFICVNPCSSVATTILFPLCPLCSLCLHFLFSPELRLWRRQYHCNRFGQRFLRSEHDSIDICRVQSPAKKQLVEESDVAVRIGGAPRSLHERCQI